MNKIWINDKVILIEASQNIIDKIKNKFTFIDSSKALTINGFDKTKIKKVCFVHKKKNFFWLYSGFAMELMLFIQKNKWPFKLEGDFRSKININIPQDNEIRNIIPEIKLYDYQIEAVKKLLKSKIGILKAPTASGKSVILSAILKILNKPFLLLVNKKSLASQLWQDFNNFGIDCGVCHSEKKIFKENMICTIKSVHRIRNLSEIKILLIDEVHRASSKTFQDFLKKFSPPIKLGFSATPEGNTKYNFALIRQFFGTIIYSINAKYLIKENKIAKPVIYFVNNISSPEINWPITEQKQIIYNKDRNNLIADFVNKNNDKCFLILVSRIEHGKILKEKIPNSVYLDGSDSVKHRDEIKNKMENGEVKVTITTNIFNEGISIKAIQVLINASARKSSIQTIQKLGRALRIKDNKKKSLVIDFQDNGNKFLYNQYEKRKNIWIKEGFDDINEVYDIDLLELDIETTLK